MKNPITIATLYISLFLVTFPLSTPSQERRRISTSSMARMDVLSRARLFEETIDIAARSEGVDPLILWTIAYNETRFRPWLTSPKNAQGLMQFMPATAARFGLTNPYEPKGSVVAAARYVKYLGRLFNWKLESVLAAYNAGEGTVSAYLQGRTLRANGKVINSSRVTTVHGIPPYKETIGYVSQGVKVYRWLEKRGVFAARPNVSLTIGTLGPKGVSTANESKDTQPVSVFYEPRTGKRTVISSTTDPSLQHHEFGQVIVGPSIQANSTKQARSTFAGPSRSLDLQK